MNRHTVPNAVTGYPGKPQNGGSNPRFYDFDDGVTRLVKWHPSSHGGKACYNELVASRLGQLIGAPILRGLIVFVADEIIPSDHRGVGATPGFHFAVARMEGENFIPDQHYNEIENRSELPCAAIQLAWLAVGDQEGHNQYLQRLEIRQEGGVPPKLTKRFRLVDMGHMFGVGQWTAPSVETVHDSYKLPVHLAQKLTFDKLASGCDELRQIPETSIQDCFEDCPDEWNIPKADREAAKNRVLKTRERIQDIIRKGNPSLK